MNPVIAFFMPTLGGGGAERVTLTLARALAERGHKVWLLVGSAAGSLAQEVPANVELVNLRARRVALAIAPLARWLRAHHPSVLIASQAHANIAAYIACRLSGTPCKLLVREESTPSVNLAHLSPVRAWTWRQLTRLVYARANAVIAVSEGAADDLQRYLRLRLSNLRVIYNPVIVPDIFEKAREGIDHPWFANSDVPVVLAVGRLTKAKNYPLLLAAFSILVQQQPARLLILGEGEERPRLEQLVRDLGLATSVSMPGFDANPFKYMARSTLYVLSSDWEGLPGALIQASALCGLVISTDCPSGPREVLDGAGHAVLVPTGDVAQLASAMSLQLSKTNSGGAPAHNRKFLERFTEGRVSLEYARLIDSE